MMLRKRCPYCRGQGAVPDSRGISATAEPCPVCSQRGYNLVPGDANLCGCCQGSGYVPAGDRGREPCPECGGIGFMW